VTLGFIELAAAFKFVSNADLVWNWGIFSRDLVLAFWVPIFALAGLYLLGKVKFVGESAADEEGRVTVVQSLAAITMFALSTYLAVGLVQGRAFGGWLDGWLPPTRYPGASVASTSGAGESAPAGAGFDWHESLEEARALAAAEDKLVFVNYTGFTCTNCRYMEEAVFPQDRVASELREMVLVELYTDGGQPHHEAARADQVARFGTAALPFYSVEQPDGTVVATFPSSTNDAAEFAAFLERAQRSGVADRGRGTGDRGRGDRKYEPGTGDDRAPSWGVGRALFGGEEKALVPVGQWTLVNFSATWCAPCREELQGFLVEVGQGLERSGGAFRTVALEADADVETARDFARELGLEDDQALRVLPETLPERWKTAVAFDGERLPFTALISPEGEVVWHRQAAVSRDEVQQALRTFVGG
jgi:thiol:disulfide interchange protein DsbD